MSSAKWPHKRGPNIVLCQALGFTLYFTVTTPILKLRLIDLLYKRYVSCMWNIQCIPNIYLYSVCTRHRGWETQGHGELYMYEYIHTYINNSKYTRHTHLTRLHIYSVYMHILICYNSIYTIYIDVHKTQRVGEGGKWRAICISIFVYIYYSSCTIYLYIAYA